MKELKTDIQTIKKRTFGFFGLCVAFILSIGIIGCLGDESFYPDGGMGPSSLDDDDDDNDDDDTVAFEDMTSEEDATKLSDDHDGWQQALCTQSDCHDVYEDDVQFTSECAACHGPNGAVKNCGESGTCWTCHKSANIPPHGEGTGTTDDDCETCHLD